jgi:hypothetical protein
MNNMNPKNIETLNKIVQEMRQKFHDWNTHIEAGQAPVPIQDLDYWRRRIETVIEKEK